MTDAPEIWKAAMQDAGSADALAERLGIARRTLFLWKRQGVPDDRVIEVAGKLGVSPGVLRPDMAAAFRGVAA